MNRQVWCGTVGHMVMQVFTSLHFNLRLGLEGPRPFQMPLGRFHSHYVDLVLLVEPRAGWGRTCNSLAREQYQQLLNRSPEFPVACSSSVRTTSNGLQCNCMCLPGLWRIAMCCGSLGSLSETLARMRCTLPDAPGIIIVICSKPLTPMDHGLQSARHMKHG